MSIKIKILTDSIQLFNEKGISSVTMKQLADYMSISPGNLTYHYKTKADLMQAIYAIMHEEAANFLVPGGHITLHSFDEAMTKYYQFNKKYRFFFNDVVFISAQFPEVHKMYLNSNLERFKQGRALIDHYVRTGRMVPEKEFISYDRLIFNVWMTMAFWTAQSFIIQDNEYQVNQTSPVAMVWQQMFPFLTEKGWEEYKEVKMYVTKDINSI